MKIKYLLFILSCTMLFSCSKENDSFSDSVLEDNTRCLLEYADSVIVLESSMNELSFYSEESDMFYKDNLGEIHTYKTEKREYALLCFHDWICEADSSQVEHFWTQRELIEKKIYSETSDYIFSFNVYASLNEKTPSTYSDILDLHLNFNEVHNCSLAEYVIDTRTDITANNDELIFIEEILIEGQMYYDVYSQQNQDFELLFNTQNGLIFLSDLNEDKSFTLISE